MIYTQENTINYTQTTPTIEKKLHSQSSKSSSPYSIFPNSQSDSSYTWGSMGSIISKELLFDDEEVNIIENKEISDDYIEVKEEMKNINTLSSSPQSVHELNKIDSNYDNSNNDNEEEEEGKENVYKNQIKSNLPNLSIYFYIYIC